MSAGPLYLDRRIAPGRALSPRALLHLLLAVAAANLLVMAVLVAIGAWPVPLFLGLDVVGVLIAFRVSNRRARRGEVLRVDAERVRVLREGDRGPPAVVWSSPTAFTTVGVHRRRRGPEVRLSMSGRATTVGAALGASARAALGRELQEAVRRARAERW